MTVKRTNMTEAEGTRHKSSTEEGKKNGEGEKERKERTQRKTKGTCRTMHRRACT